MKDRQKKRAHNNNNNNNNNNNMCVIHCRSHLRSSCVRHVVIIA